MNLEVMEVGNESHGKKSVLWRLRPLKKMRNIFSALRMKGNWDSGAEEQKAVKLEIYFKSGKKICLKIGECITLQS